MLDPEQQRLIVAIAAAPVADPAPWLAYADWLDARRDRRGDVIRQSIACEVTSCRTFRDFEQRQKLLSPLYGDDLMSPRLRAQARHWRLSWFRGFITSARLRLHEHDAPAQEAIEALLDDPHASRLQLTLVDMAATLGDPFEPSASRGERILRMHQPTRILWWALLCTSRPHVRTLDVWGLDQVGIDRLDQLPALEKLELHSPGVARIAHPELRDLTCDGEAFATAAAIDLPRLERLSWGFGSPPTAMLERPPPKLAEIVFGNPVVDTLARSALASQIRVIYTRPDVVRNLAPCMSRFPMLRRLVVDAPRRVLDELRRDHAGVEIVDDEPATEHMLELDTWESD